MNRLDLVHIKARLLAHIQCAVDGVVYRARARIRLEFDQQFIWLVDAFDQFAGEIFVGKRLEKTALTFEYGVRAGEAQLRHQGCGNAITRRRPRIKTLLHRRAVHLHQARRLRARHAESVGDFRRIQFENF